jgi:hypothetical protein
MGRISRICASWAIAIQPRTSKRALFRSSTFTAVSAGELLESVLLR